jgi:hypothetical protein
MDWIGLDRWVREESTPQNLAEDGHRIGCLEVGPKGVRPIDRRIRGMQGKEPTSTRDPILDGRLSGHRRSHIARVGDQNIGIRKETDVLVVGRDLRPDSLVDCEELQQLETSEVEVVPLPTDDEDGVDATGHREGALRN